MLVKMTPSSGHSNLERLINKDSGGLLSVGQDGPSSGHSVTDLHASCVSRVSDIGSTDGGLANLEGGDLSTDINAGHTAVRRTPCVVPASPKSLKDTEQKVIR